MKVQKNKTGEHVPPPRPKRKAPKAKKKCNEQSLSYIADSYYSAYGQNNWPSGSQFMNTSNYIVILLENNLLTLFLEYVPGVVPTQQQAQVQAHYYLQDVFSNQQYPTQTQSEFSISFFFFL